MYCHKIMAKVANRCVRVFSVFLDVSRGSHLPFRVLQQPRYALTGSIRPSSLGSPSSWQSRALRRAARTKDAALHLFSKCIVRRARLRSRPRPGAQPHCSPIVCDRMTRTQLKRSAKGERHLRVVAKVGGRKRYTRHDACLLYTSPSPRDPKTSRMPSSA